MLKKSIYLFLLLWLIVCYNSELRDTSVPIIGLGTNIVLEGIIFVLAAPFLFRRIYTYKKWVIVVLLFWGLSTTWSVNPNSFEFYWKYGLIYLLAFSVSSVVKSKQDVELMMKLDLIAVFLCGVYVLFFLNTGDLADERLGQDQGPDSVWNANDIGMKMAIGYAISIYYILKNKKNFTRLLPLLIVFLIVAFFSGSRKVVLLLIMFTATLMIARSKGQKKFLAVIFAFFLVIGLYYAVMSVPFLYDIVGRRIGLLIDGLSGGDGGSSLRTRSYMVLSGFGWFLNRPWIGYGIDGFRVLFGNLTGWEVYAHNNFIELLVGTGIIGFVLYYSLTFYIIVELWKPALRDKDKLALVLFLYTFISTIIDFAIVSYVQETTIFRLMYTASYCQILRQNKAINYARAI